MTFKILTDDTQKVIYRHRIRTATDPQTRNLRLDPLNNEDDKDTADFLRKFVWSYNENPDVVLPDNGEGNPKDPHAPTRQVPTIGSRGGD